MASPRSQTGAAATVGVVCVDPWDEIQRPTDSIGRTPATYAHLQALGGALGALYVCRMIADAAGVNSMAYSFPVKRFSFHAHLALSGRLHLNGRESGVYGPYTASACSYIKGA